LSGSASAALLVDAAMERIPFDKRDVVHPAAFPGMRDKVIIRRIGVAGYRLIGRC